MAAEEKLFLNVRFKDNDQVKKLGAKWDSRQRGWWITDRQDRQEFILSKNPRAAGAEGKKGA
jgi:hypothetical protein